MNVKRLNSKCIICLIDKYLKNLPETAAEEAKTSYMQGVLKIISNAGIEVSAPELVEEIVVLQEKILGEKTDYSAIKSHFNQLMLSVEDDISAKINKSADPIKTAVCYALSGNYIDFGAMQSVDENELKRILDNVSETNISDIELDNLKSELSVAKKLVYITDNCGEIVLDKLLIKTITEHNPQLKVDVIVRGEAVLNDCTIEDAVEIGMYRYADVTPNGTAIAGTCLNRISAEARDLIEGADLIIAKGQGNFETLHHSGKNIYYLFLCKCKMFAERFNVKPLSGMLINDMRM